MKRKRVVSVLLAHLIVLAIIAGALPAKEVEQKTETAEEEKKSTLSPLQPSLQRSSASRSPLSPLYNRWRILDAYGVQIPRNPAFDPYNQNALKGDLPISGLNTFMVLTGLYNPKVISNSQANVETVVNNDIVTAIELFGGSTVFKPKDWSAKISTKAIANRGNNDVDDFAFLEIFAEKKLFDVGDDFDFTSIRLGSQFFKSDFNGFIFQDFNLGGQLFGEVQRNKYQWSAAYLDLLAKENGLLTTDSQNQQILFGNLFWQDFLRPGFDAVFSLHLNQDRQIDGQDLDVTYIGFASAGHWGRSVISPALYFAVGTDDLIGADISAFFAGVEFERPINYLNYRFAAFIASGDDDLTDDKAKGFDSINDNVALFGAANSFFVGGGAFGTRNNSFLPTFRPVGTRANFANPGILLLNAGLDAVLTPKLFLEANLNYFELATDQLPDFQNGVAVTAPSKSLGFELNSAFNYRVFLNENFILQAGVNAFFPAEGGEFLLGSSDTIITSNLALVALF